MSKKIEFTKETKLNGVEYKKGDSILASDSTSSRLIDNGDAKVQEVKKLKAKKGE